jgi:hypothetical protein
MIPTIEPSDNDTYGRLKHAVGQGVHNKRTELILQMLFINKKDNFTFHSFLCVGFQDTQGHHIIS